MSDMRVEIRQGKGGRWRWLLYEDDKCAAVSMVRGFATNGEAFQAAMRHFGSSVEVHRHSGDPDMDWPQYAGAARLAGLTVIY